MGVKLNGPEAADKNLIFNFNFTDSGDRYRITVANGVLNYKAPTRSPDADATITLSRQGLIALTLLGRLPASLIETGIIAAEGNNEYSHRRAGPPNKNRDRRSLFFIGTPTMIDAAHPCAAPLRGALRASKTAVLPFCRTNVLIDRPDHQSRTGTVGPCS